MPPLLLYVFMVKHICASRNWSLFCFRNSLGNKLFLTRPRYLNPIYNSVQQPQNRGKQTLTHEHVDSIAWSILKRDFGYDDFRHEQAAAIRTILQGENALVVFPTGAGKSLCYQIPAIAFEELDAIGLTERQPRTAELGSGITIVVSPLIALMKDQIDSL
ncbi:hypothetical protein F4823DRAFT_569458 [Ustulina deusta]|nr:hypothetical protein F4823DRAFT_569458 [Ustulina deusta]